MGVEHSFPAAVLPLLGTSYGVFRPGQDVSKFDTGPVMSRDWFEYNLRRYQLEIVAQDTTGTELDEYDAFLGHIGISGTPFWFKEVQSASHRNLLCGPLASGSQSSFPLPVVSPSSVTVFDDGTPQAAGTTSHTSANVMSDNMASFETSITGWVLFGTCAISRVTGIAADGLASALVDPTGTVGDVGIRTDSSYRPAVDGSQEYTIVASVHGAGNFQIGWLCYDTGGASLPTGDPGPDRVWSSVQAGDAAAWTQISYTQTTDATATHLDITVERDTVSANNFYVDCVGVVPGDLVRWHLPSVAPGVVEFGADPAQYSRITASATGNRLARVRLETDTPSWTFRGAYSAYPSRLTLVEDIEV